MARILKEFIRKNSLISQKFISTLTPEIKFTNLSPQTPLIFGINPKINTTLLRTNEDEFANLSKLDIYPGLSVGYFLNPNLESGSGPDSQMVGPNAGGSEHPEDGIMWADSVKKKRKKKMNKHKYKKLRKRLRRKTK